MLCDFPEQFWVGTDYDQHLEEVYEFEFLLLVVTWHQEVEVSLYQAVYYLISLCLLLLCVL